MLLRETKYFTELKVWNSPPKKCHWKNRRTKKSVEKMQARGKTCFSATHKRHYPPGTERTCPKNTTANETYKHNYCPKMQPRTTRWWYSVSTRPPDVILPPLRPCMMADLAWPMEITNCPLQTRKMRLCNKSNKPNPEILKAVDEIALASRRNDAWQRS